jgi:hypothetical protein
MKPFKSQFFSAAIAAVVGLGAAATYVRTHAAQLVMVTVVTLASLFGVITPAEASLLAPLAVLSVLDVFKQDAFSVVSLTDAINKVPYVPGRAGQVINWDEQGVPTTTIMLEEYQGSLQIINPSPRGGPGATTAKEKRTARNLTIPHYEHNDAVMADEVQGVRAFGQETQLQTVQQLVDRRLTSHVQLKLDPTLEYQRVGAVKGVILNGDGSTLYDLFAEFGVTQDAEIDFNLDVDGSATGALRTLCNVTARTLAGYMEGTPYAGIYAFCGDTFFDTLINNPEVVRTYLNQQEASQLRGNLAYSTFDFGGIRWENYRGAIGGTPFIATDKCHIFPVGTPGWRTIYAPADYIDTVNTIGLPRYARQFDMPNGKGVNLDSQMNALNYFTRPKALLKGRRT